MDIKHKIYLQLQKIISDKIIGINESLSSAKESRDADTKSSAGDKHETSRALAQIEIDKLEVQLNKTLFLQKELNDIQINKSCGRVEQGSLVFTSQENYFISVALGKIEIEDQRFYAISLSSPIGKILEGKTMNDQLTFQGREIVIEQIK